MKQSGPLPYQGIQMTAHDFESLLSTGPHGPRTSTDVTVVRGDRYAVGYSAVLISCLQIRLACRKPSLSWYLDVWLVVLRWPLSADGLCRLP